MDEDLIFSELLFFKERNEVLQIIDCLSAKNYILSEFDSHFLTLTKILSQYQEQSQLLESSMSSLIKPLGIVLVHVANTTNEKYEEVYYFFFIFEPHALCPLFHFPVLYQSQTS